MRVLRVGLVAVVVGVAVLALLWGLQRRLIYLPMPSDVPPVAQALSGAEEVVLETADGLELGAWVARPEPGDDRGVAVLVANGNAGHRGMRAPLAQALRDEGLTVLLFDYRGFGGNEGSPSEEGLVADAAAARRYLVEEEGVAPDRLVYFGESVGTGVVAGLAAERPPAGLLLRSPFPDLAAVGRRHYPFLPVRTLLRDRYPVAEQLADLDDVPTVVIYGTDDGIVPPELSREVAAAAAGPTDLVAVEGADHNDRALLDGEELVAATVALADRVAER